MAVPLLRLIRYEERMECINTRKNKSGDVVFRGMYGGIVLFGKGNLPDIDCAHIWKLAPLIDDCP